MQDIQTHLDKIRSDAAECVLLSNLVADGKGEVFAKTAEHLRSLASEVEKTIAANGAKSARDEAEHPAPEQHTEVVAGVPHRYQQRSSATLVILWFLTALLGGVIGVMAWTNNSARYWISSLSSQPETTSAFRDDTKRILSLLSGDQEERKVVLEQVNALSTRVDSLGRVVDSLKTTRATTSNQETIRAEEKPTYRGGNGAGSKRGSKFALCRESAPIKPTRWRSANDRRFSRRIDRQNWRFSSPAEA